MSVPRVEQLDRAALDGMSPRQIEDARKAGRLAQMLGTAVPVDWSQVGQLAREDVAELAPHEIEQARRGGHLDELLDPAPPPGRAS